MPKDLMLNVYNHNVTMAIIEISTIYDKNQMDVIQYEFLSEIKMFKFRTIKFSANHYTAMQLNKVMYL